MTTHRVISWNTKKVEGGFEYRVYSHDYLVPAVVHQRGVCRTRAIAKNRAQKWTRYLKAQQRAAA